MSAPLGPAQPVGASVFAAGSTPPRADGAGARREKVLLSIGVVAAILLRAILVPINGGWGDLDQYAGWVHRLATDVPFGSAYRLDLSYMPALVAVFGALAHVVPGFATATDASDLLIRVALKLPPLVADGACAVGVYLLAGGRRQGRAAAALAVLVLPATWYLSAWWGQWDAIYAAAAIWVAVLAVRDRPIAAGILLGLALMTKPQALFLAVPFAAWMLASWNVRRGIGCCDPRLRGWGSHVVAIPVCRRDPGLPSQHRELPGPLLPVSLGRGLELLGVDPGAGRRRPFRPGLPGGPRTAHAAADRPPDDVRGRGPHRAGVIRRPTNDRLLLGLAAATLVSFNLMTTMHERYSYAALVFLAPLLARPAVFLAWSILAVTISLNILAAAPPNQQAGSVVPVSGPIGAIGSLAIVAATILVVVLLVRTKPGEPDRAPRSTGMRPGKRRHLLGRRRPVPGPDGDPATV
jgi:hypothetical protein